MSFILLGILNAQAEAGAVGDYELLETTILTSSASSVSFTGLGSYTDYKHLQLRMLTRSDRASGSTEVVMLTFNSDTGSNYAYHELRGNGSSVSSGAGTSQTATRLSISPANDNPAGVFSPCVADILDFSSTTKNTTVRSLSGLNGNADDFIDFRSGLYNSTSAITSMNLDQIAGSNWLTGSRFSLYGIRAA